MGFRKNRSASSSLFSLSYCFWESNSSSVSKVSSPSSRDKKEDIANSHTASTYTCLLRKLDDLEHNHENWESTPSVAESVEAQRKTWCLGRVGKSVAVMKETANPFGEFQCSMRQMIVENKIVGGEELRKLLGLFLELNSPLYHELILRAFADILVDVISGLERTPELLRLSKRFL